MIPSTLNSQVHVAQSSSPKKKTNKTCLKKIGSEEWRKELGHFKSILFKCGYSCRGRIFNTENSLSFLVTTEVSWTPASACRDATLSLSFSLWWKTRWNPSYDTHCTIWLNPRWGAQSSTRHRYKEPKWRLFVSANPQSALRIRRE